MKPDRIITSLTDRQRWRELELRPSSTVQPGRVMFWKGPKIIGYADVATLTVNFIPKGATAISVSLADADDFKEWIK